MPRSWGIWCSATHSIDILIHLVGFRDAMRSPASGWDDISVIRRVCHPSLTNLRKFDIWDIFIIMYSLFWSHLLDLTCSAGSPRRGSPNTHNTGSYTSWFPNGRSNGTIIHPNRSDRLIWRCSILDVKTGTECHNRDHVLTVSRMVSAFSRSIFDGTN